MKRKIYSLILFGLTGSTFRLWLADVDGGCFIPCSLLKQVLIWHTQSGIPFAPEFSVQFFCNITYHSNLDIFVFVIRFDSTMNQYLSPIRIIITSFSISLNKPLLQNTFLGKSLTKQYFLLFIIIDNDRTKSIEKRTKLTFRLFV